MSQISAGLLMYRRKNGNLEFFLVHPGGPFFQSKDEGAWTIPKGLVEGDEDILAAAIREFKEETGLTAGGHFLPLGTVKMKSGKILHAWAFSGDWDESSGITSNTFTLEWPPRSKKFIEIPEADKATWASQDQAIRLIHHSQATFLDRARYALSEKC